MEYTIESLKEINQRYLQEHSINQFDVDKANKYTKIIGSSRSNEMPKVGDILRYTTKHGDYYEQAHIENVEADSIYVCESPCVPFIHISIDNTGMGIYCSTSGGAWTNIKKSELKYIGKEFKTFKDWGSCGAGKDGAIYFTAEVSIWEYKAETPLYGEYTTKDYRKKYILSRKNDDSQYEFFGDNIAFASETDYQAWLKTYKGVEFEGNWDSQKVVFYYRENEHYISHDEWTALDLPIDTRLCNGIIFVKVKYDDENHCIEAYRFTNDGSENYKNHSPYELARKNAIN